MKSVDFKSTGQVIAIIIKIWEVENKKKYGLPGLKVEIAILSGKITLLIFSTKLNKVDFLSILLCNFTKAK